MLSSNCALRSEALAALMSSLNSTTAGSCLAFPTFTQREVTTPCQIPGEKPDIANTVSLVLPSGAYSEILRLPCRFSIQSLSNPSRRRLRNTTNDGSLVQE